MILKNERKEIENFFVINTVWGCLCKCMLTRFFVHMQNGKTYSIVFLHCWQQFVASLFFIC